MASTFNPWSHFVFPNFDSLIIKSFALILNWFTRGDETAIGRDLVGLLKNEILVFLVMLEYKLGTETYACNSRT